MNELHKKPSINPIINFLMLLLFAVSILNILIVVSGNLTLPQYDGETAYL